MNPAEWLQRSAGNAPGRAALLLGDTVVASYGSFAARAAHLAAELSGRGVAPGDRVAIFAKNCPEYLIALYGIWHAGAIAVPINAKLHPREAAWIIGDAGAQVCFVTEEAARDLAVEPGAEGCALWSLGNLPAVSEGALSAPHPTLPQDVIWLFYTSGTTGRPKGVMLTALNLMLMTLSYLADVDEVSEQDAILYAAPMSHGAGLYNFIHVMRGARHVVPPSGGFEAAEVLDLAARLGNVSMFAAPTMVRRLVDAARVRGGAEGLKTVIYGGGPMYLADIVEAVEVMGPRLVQIYGQGECPMAITALSRAEVADRSAPNWRARLASVGRAQSGVRLGILRPDGSPAPVGEIGEVVVQGALVMAGYWAGQTNGAESTAKAIRDGWLWTGDMGALDADGYLTLHDRSKDVIISGGTNIYPREVEEVLLTHPGVHEVSVIGRPDPEWGEDVVAFVVCRPGSAVTPEELDALCLANIARFKRPKAYFFVPDLPKNNYGKVLKGALRDKLKEETA
ncbi:AMP-binding protein [Pseudothioclava arenosa]|uniref:3-methylmercaptopropionyl-CoA ligase n=1 Tax=Pseudothioclava arenosa TaxID=1795308 RepID=A0A2A4CSR7_9RHOB|nr:AMP-binding protein [Pseudothioclava arenosa]PCD77390.1 AMP-dependent synthetase [Pseudothioclava arenosa]